MKKFVEMVDDKRPDEMADDEGVEDKDVKECGNEMVDDE